MDSGIAAILGALIGAISSPLVAWASEHFKHPVTRKSDKLRRKRLEKILLLATKNGVRLSIYPLLLARMKKERNDCFLKSMHGNPFQRGGIIGP